MAEKNLAQLIRERMDNERDACIDAEVRRQWDVAMEVIEKAASRGNSVAMYPEGWLSGYAWDAHLILKKKLEENGFRVKFDRGTWIDWWHVD